MDKLFTFWHACKSKFRSLEMHDRAVRRLDGYRDPDLQLSNKRKRPASATLVLQSDKRPRDCARDARSADILGACVRMPPKRGTRQPKRTCIVCGYAVSGADVRKMEVMTCCNRVSHRECWLAQSASDSNCTRVVSYLRKDRTGVEPVKILLATRNAPAGP